jgi:hypothetical protein
VPDRFSLKAAAVDQKIMAGHRRPKARPRPSAESEIRLGRGHAQPCAPHAVRIDPAPVASTASR